MMVSFRRFYLDQILASIPFKGIVLDVGGERETARGKFRAPTVGIEKWIYLNPEAATKPDIIGSADAIPLPENSVDMIKFTEVLEHLQTPQKALAECYRVLKPNSVLICSVPFLYPVHGDPYDFTRWTPTGLRNLLQEARFSSVEIQPMGGWRAVCADIFEFQCSLEFQQNGKLSLRHRILRILMRRVFVGSLLRRDQKDSFKTAITTGYFVKAIKT